MPNSIKYDGESGSALQVTKQARASELVEEDANGDPTRLAPVRVHAFHRLLLITDRKHITNDNLKELQLSAIRDAGPIRHVSDVKLSIAGNGYQVALPGYKEAGFKIGDTTPVYPGTNMLVIATDTQQRLARDLVTIREEQTTEL